MARTAAAGLLLLASLARLDALRGRADPKPAEAVAATSVQAPPVTKEDQAMQSAWTYMPKTAPPKLGIVTGGRADLYVNKSDFATQTAEIMLAYAKKHGFAIHIEKDLGALSERKPTWNKIALMRKLLGDVPLLVWVNPNIIATSPKNSLEMLFKNAPCQGARQEKYNEFLPLSPDNETWLWLNGDSHQAGKYEYPLNANTNMMMVRRSNAAKQFLEKVWELGNSPKISTKYSFYNKDRVKGWPFENGAIWDLVTGDPERIMRNTCVAPNGYLESRWNSAETAEFGKVISDDMPEGFRDNVMRGALAASKMPLY